MQRQLRFVNDSFFPELRIRCGFTGEVVSEQSRGEWVRDGHNLYSCLSLSTEGAVCHEMLLLTSHGTKVLCLV